MKSNQTRTDRHRLREQKQMYKSLRNLERTAKRQERRERLTPEPPTPTPDGVADAIRDAGDIDLAEMTEAIEAVGLEFRRLGDILAAFLTSPKVGEIVDLLHRILVEEPGERREVPCSAAITTEPRRQAP